jgi:hypothetical protein
LILTRQLAQQRFRGRQHDHLRLAEIGGHVDRLGSNNGLQDQEHSHHHVSRSRCANSAPSTRANPLTFPMDLEIQSAVVGFRGDRGRSCRRLFGAVGMVCFGSMLAPGRIIFLNEELNRRQSKRRRLTGIR